MKKLFISFSIVLLLILTSCAEPVNIHMESIVVENVDQTITSQDTILIVYPSTVTITRMFYEQSLVEQFRAEGMVCDVSYIKFPNLANMEQVTNITQKYPILVFYPAHKVFITHSSPIVSTAEWAYTGFSPHNYVQVELKKASITLWEAMFASNYTINVADTIIPKKIVKDLSQNNLCKVDSLTKIANKDTSIINVASDTNNSVGSCIGFSAFVGSIFLLFTIVAHQ